MSLQLQTVELNCVSREHSSSTPWAPSLAFSWVRMRSSIRKRLFWKLLEISKGIPSFFWEFLWFFGKDEKHNKKPGSYYLSYQNISFFALVAFIKDGFSWLIFRSFNAKSKQWVCCSLEIFKYGFDTRGTDFLPLCTCKEPTESLFEFIEWLKLGSGNDINLLSWSIDKADVSTHIGWCAWE